ncbi:hypothetical protein BGX27_004545 [Mortierella sp. AM989]|nr:hypothetical protein BGX27_004545 [Mortierella sp. AM989]
MANIITINNVSPLLERNIILVGKTGTGKSSIANMLVQGDLFEVNQMSVSDRARGETREFKTGRGCGWAATDTAGLGECKLGTVDSETALELIKMTLKESQKGFHHIGFVIKKGRIATEELKDLFELFKTLFAGAEKNFVLIVTNCEDEGWLDENKDDIREIFGLIEVISCNFPFNKKKINKGKEDRKESLVELVKKLKDLNTESIQPMLCRESTADAAIRKRFEREVSRVLGTGFIERISALLKSVWDTQ